MVIHASETLIVGSWVMRNGRVTSDAEEKRIDELIRGELQKLSIAPSGWEVLYWDPRDGRYWELFHPHSEMHGGGPRSLRVLDPEIVREKYGSQIDSQCSP
jgi:hypothetical protein